MAVANKKASFVTSDFEVFGKVQGVYFRKHTQKKAMELGLKGWVMNTAQGTVVGQIQGPAVAVEDMKTWLQKVGSPKSRIEKAAFKNEGPVVNCAFRSFDIRR
ncbi:acylphosphatase-1-like [Spodoptera litura]|uniref:Acylphosphatase n=1 Tax=Spodoptera litura TaxID=69820 RepID=A0A9J7IHC2_SPOLT|nr:acylphosphatase-1-like [Spodoptera litura]